MVGTCGRYLPLQMCYPDLQRPVPPRNSDLWVTWPVGFPRINPQVLVGDPDSCSPLDGHLNKFWTKKWSLPDVVQTKLSKFGMTPDVWSKPNFEIQVRPNACLNKIASSGWRLVWYILWFEVWTPWIMFLLTLHKHCHCLVSVTSLIYLFILKRTMVA